MNFPKLVWPVAITSGILLVLGIVGAWYVLRLQTRASDILAWNVTSIRAATELEIGVRDIRTQLNRFLLTEDVKLLDEIPKLQPDCETSLAESVRLARHPEEEVLIAKAADGFELFLRDSKQLTHPNSMAELRALVRKLTDDVLRDQVLAHTHAYLEYNERELATSSEHNQILAERLALSLSLIGVCGASAGLLAGFVLARGILRTIVQIRIPIHDVAGQLNEVVEPISYSHVSQLEDLDQVLRTIASRVSDVIDRLRQRERDAVRAEQLAALGQLSAGLAHELRNPLMSMKILVQSAQSDERGLLDGADLDVLDMEIVRLEKLVSTFLDFARPPTLTKRRINLTEILNQTLDLVMRQAHLRGVKLHFNHGNQVVTIEGDAGQLRQVFLNLLLNSLDAITRGGDIWVGIDCQNINRSQKPSVGVVVSDNGHGVAAELRGTIFEPFVSTKPIGIGLGLTICRRIAEAHHGQISIADREGGGAVFRLELPITSTLAGAEG